MKKQLFVGLMMLTIILLSPIFLFAQGSFVPGSEHGFNGETFGVSVGDIDGDGDLDAVVIDAYDAIEVWFNGGNGIFTDSAYYATGDDYYGVELVDMDGDGDLDIVAINFYTSQDASIYKNNGSGVFTLFQTINTDDTEESKLADLDGDGDKDLFHTGGAPEVWLNSGTGWLTTGGTFSNSTGDKSDVALADFDGDGDIDAFFADDNGFANELWLNNGSASFTYSASFADDEDYTGIDTADFDGDGDIDVVLVGMYIYPEIWLNNGSGVFTLGSTLPDNDYDKSVVTSDIDGDGDMDIIISSYSGGVEVWKNGGTANFTLFYNDNSSSHDVAVGDFNGDGAKDIYLGKFSSGSGDIVYFQDKITTGFSLENQESMKLYPNPANDIIQIELDTELNESVILSIFDLSGRVVLEEKIKAATSSLDISDLSKGAYIYRLVDKNNNILYQDKLIKM